MADSLRIYHLAPDFLHLIDFGSGAGFSNLVITILLVEKSSEGMVYLVERNQRKAAFLRTIIR